ncbi:MAG TPA: hypothetical protein VLA43_02670, partial [Longimicrobiales bacterium]|nr:hypothetical protein [Longimicrobiales bacterium]
MVPGQGSGLRSRLLLGVALGAAGFHLFAAGVAPFTALVQRPVHLALMGILGFWAARTLPGAEPRREGAILRGWLTLLSAVLVGAAVYLALQHETLVARSGAPTPVDLVLGAATVVAVLDLTRRTTGWGLVAVAC